jgi:hypothetical protein
VSSSVCMLTEHILYNFIPEFSVTGLFWSAASVMYLWQKFQHLFATVYLKTVKIGAKNSDKMGETKFCLICSISETN